MPAKEEKEWKSGYAGKMHPGREEKKERKKSAAGDAPPKKDKASKTEPVEEKKKAKEEPVKGKDVQKGEKPKAKDDKEKPKDAKETHAKGKAVEEKGKDDKAKGKDDKAKPKDEKVKEEKTKDKGTSKPAKEVNKGAKGKDKLEPIVEPDEESLTASQLAAEEAAQRAMQRKMLLHRRQWPEVTKVKITTKPWAPPGPPEKPPKVVVELPPLKLRNWIPPWMRRKRPRPKLPRMLPEQMTAELPEGNTLRRIWHNFVQVDTNKMMIRGNIGCNSKRYSSTTSGSQTGCIALVCRALLDDKTPAQLTKQDVDDVIEAGDRFYRMCMKGMKCYKGKPALELQQLLPDFYFRDFKYTVEMQPAEKGVLCKHPDNAEAGPDLLGLMDKYIGQQYMFILTVNGDRHFLIWGHPPDAAGTSVKTVCYIFDPHMLDELGFLSPVGHGCESCGGGPFPGACGAGAFLRYPGVTSFCLDFLANHANLKDAKRARPRPPITLTSIEVVDKRPIPGAPGYDLDLRTYKAHCRSEWEALNINAMIDEKLYKGKWPFASMSAESLAASKKSSRYKVTNFMKKLPKEPPPPSVPVAPEKPPPQPPADSLNQYKGEDFFLHCPRVDQHTYGRDDLVPLPEPKKVTHSLYEMADQAFESAFDQIADGKWIARGTRHFASYRYQLFKSFTGVACCVAALAMLRKHRARAWNEDTIDETCDVGWNLFRESLMERRGPVRRLVLGELKDTFHMRDKTYRHKERGIAVWGKLMSKNPKVFDICRGIEEFFKESDSGILQIPGEFETAIWYEGGRYFMYHPWPADKNGNRVGLQGGGKACLISFTSIAGLCEHFLDNVRELKRKPYSISDVGVWDLGERPEPVNNMKAAGPDRWIIRGSFHEGDERFPEEHRNKQATPTSIAAIAMATLIDPAEWTQADVDEVLIRGDILYEKTIENLDKMGINLEQPPRVTDEGEGEGEEETGPGPSGTLAAADVLPRFNISEYDCIETDIQDSEFSGMLQAEPGSGVMSLKDSLKALFVHNKAGVVTARGGSVAVWKHDDYLYFFDPHGCDENGLPSEEPLSGACLLRLKNDVKELADAIMGNLAPGADDSFNISPVEILNAKLNPETGAPEIQQEGKAFEWLNKKTATILMGPRGENSAIGKAAAKCAVPKEDLAGRSIALPAIAAFCAATDAVQPPGMHQDHMFNFLEAGGEYYLNHVRSTGRKDITIEDLNEKFEMGVNTFSIEVGAPTRLPLRLPDKPAEGGGEEEEAKAGDVLGEGEEAPKEKFKEMKELLFKMWYDNTKPSSVSLLVGDYHQLGVWMAPGGKVVAFDPAPTLAKGLLTPHRIQKGDELRNQRLKEEKVGEAEEEAEDEGGGEEAQPEPEQYVPPESCPVLMIFASPGEFIDKLVLKGGLNPKQAIAPYWLYPVAVTNELTSSLKEKKPGAPAPGEEAEDADNEEEGLVEALSDEAMGKYFQRKSRTVASMRGSVAQDEHYFMERPNRDHQDAAISVMGIIVQHIEPYQYWKPSLVDGILKYGDRLYTLSIPNAEFPPHLRAAEVINEFHVHVFNIRTDVEGDVVVGDYKAGEHGSPLNLRRGLKKFFDGGHNHAVICAKHYCVGVWRAMDEKAWVYWDPHPVGPTGKLSPASAAGAVLFSTLDELAETFKTNLANLCRPGTNKYTISAVKVSWEFSLVPMPLTPAGATPDEGYEWKVLTAFVEVGRGRTILRGCPPIDLPRFTRDALIASAPSAIVAGCMTFVRQPPLWTRKTVDDVMRVGCNLFNKAIQNLGYEFRPGEDILLPLQVPKKFVLGVNFIRYDLQSAYTGRLEQRHPPDMTAKSAIEKFFANHTHGVFWCAPHAVAIWRVPGAPAYFMMEPHACGPTGLRTDAKEDGAACVQTFTSAKLLAHTYLQNLPPPEHYKRHFVLYELTVRVTPIRPLGKRDPPLVRPQRELPPGTMVVPATSKVDVYGQERRAQEGDRVHPPGDLTWKDELRALQDRDKEGGKKGIRNANGWLVLVDGSQFLSASHSISCKRYTFASRGNQALACSVMAVAMSAVEEVCRWCSSTLNQILDSGDQLYQDSFLHYQPKNTTILSIEQILRKFYTPGNCVCRVVVYKARQTGSVKDNFTDTVRQFFREERAGVFVAYGGEFAVALFKTPRGFYMFDPADRDRYGNAVPPALAGRARACFSQFPTVASLCEVLRENIGPPTKPPPSPDEPVITKSKTTGPGKEVGGRQSQVKFKEVEEKPAPPPATNGFAIYGMGVSSLRRLNQYEK